MPERSKEKDVASTLGAGSLAMTGSTFASGLLSHLLSAGTKKAPRYLSREQAEQLSEAMGFPPDEPLVMWGQPKAEWTGKWVSMPGEPTEPIPSPALAHELGHARGGPVQKVTGGVSEALFTRPVVGIPVPEKGMKRTLGDILKGKKPGFSMRPIMGPAVSPLHVPLAIAAAAPKSEKKGLKWIQEHPAHIAAGIAAVPLLQELHASARGLRGIQKMPRHLGGGTRGAAKAAVPLAKAFATHALAHVPAIAALYATSKIRDWMARRREAKESEKTASYPGLVRSAFSAVGSS